MLSGTTSSRTVTRCAHSRRPQISASSAWLDFSHPLFPIFLSCPLYFFVAPSGFLSVALGDFSADLQLKFPSESINVSEKRSRHVSGSCRDLLHFLSSLILRGQCQKYWRSQDIFLLLSEDLYYIQRTTSPGIYLSSFDHTQVLFSTQSQIFCPPYKMTTT